MTSEAYDIGWAKGAVESLIEIVRGHTRELAELRSSHSETRRRLDASQADLDGQGELSRQVDMLTRRVDGLAEAFEDMSEDSLAVTRASNTVDGRVVVSAAAVERWELIEGAAVGVAALSTGFGDRSDMIYAITALREALKP